MTSQNSTFPYNSPNNLPELSFIAGTSLELTFDIYDSGSSLMDLTGATTLWHLAPYGAEASSVTETAVYSGSPVGRLVVTVPGDDTVTLYGKYVQQIAISTLTDTYRPSQGLVNITRALS